MDDDSARSPASAARTALRSIVAFWTFYCLVASLRSVVLGFDAQLAMLGRRIVVTLLSMGISWLIWLVLRRVSAARPARSLAAAALLSVPAALTYAGINQRAFANPASISVGDARGQPLARPHGTPPLARLADVAVNGYFFFTAWAALYLALAFAAEGRAAERRSARFRAAARTAELRALRYQVNPHFLFNTLNSLSALVITGRPDEAERMIQNLSTFFRSSLAGDPAADTPLADEIALQRLYLAIESVRFPDRIAVVEDIAADVADARVPGMILQPLIENVVRHGVSHTRMRVTVAIRAWAEADMLALSVVDDAPATPLSDGGGGIGLRNVADRLAARFGPHALCRAQPVEGGGFAVTMLIPLLR